MTEERDLTHILESGKQTYWGSTVGFLGKINYTFAICGHEMS